MTAEPAPAAIPADAAAVPFDERRLGRTVLRLAWPVVGERASFATLVAMDGVLVGRYVGEDGLAGVGVAALIFYLPVSAAQGLTVATSTVIGWDYGGRARDKLNETLRSAMFLALAIGLFSFLVLFLGADLLIGIMGLEEAAHDDGVTYMRRAALGVFGLSVFEAAAGALRGVGNTRLPMFIVLLVNLINAGLTFLLISDVIGIELGAAAAGWGYGTGGLLGGLVATAVMARGYGDLRWNPAEALAIAGRPLKRLLNLAVPVAIEEAQFMLAFLVYVRIISGISTTATAAHTVAIRTVDFAIVPSFGFATAATVLTGQAMGARRPDLAERVGKTARLYATAFLTTLGLVAFIFAPQIAGIFTNEEPVIDEATDALRVFSLAFPAWGIFGALAGTLRGAGDVRFVLLIITATAWGLRVPVAFIGAHVFSAGLAGAWSGAVVEMTIRAGITWWRFASGRWKRLRV